PSTSSCWPRAARVRPRSSAPSWVSTSPIRDSGAVVSPSSPNNWRPPKPPPRPAAVSDPFWVFAAERRNGRASPTPTTPIDRRWEWRGARAGTPEGMSDLEHELIVEFGDAQYEADEMRRLARRAVVAASRAQAGLHGRHGAWIDDALRDVIAQQR